MFWGGPPGSPEEDGDRFLEFWNLVFMQFEQTAPVSALRFHVLLSIPALGWSAWPAFCRAFRAFRDGPIQSAYLCNGKTLLAKAEGDQAASFRVIADHLRSSAFLIADGVLAVQTKDVAMSASYHAPWYAPHAIAGCGRTVEMYKLLPALVGDEMGRAYPELCALRDP